MSIRCEYNSERPYDERFENVVAKAKELCTEEDDDAVILAYGETGSGKSNLFLWFMHLYMGEQRNINCVAMTRAGFTTALKYVKDLPQPRLLFYDEANISKRDGLAKWNKMMIDTYFSIRGKNICHLWCNPSIDYLDKEFIQERIKRVFLVIKPRTKEGKKSPFRRYYYFKIDNLINIFEKYGDLKYKTIYKVRKKYATYCGWFKAYNIDNGGDAKLIEDYKSLKDNRMDEKIDKLHEEFGEGAKEPAPVTNTVFYEKLKEMKAKGMSNAEIGHSLGVSPVTIQRKWSSYKLNQLSVTTT